MLQIWPPTASFFWYVGWVLGEGTWPSAVAISMIPRDNFRASPPFIKAMVFLVGFLSLFFLFSVLFFGQKDSISPRLKSATDQHLKTRAANGGRLDSAEPLFELASVYFKMGQPALFATEYSRHRITRGMASWSKFYVVTDGGELLKSSFGMCCALNSRSLHDRAPTIHSKAAYSEWLRDFLEEPCTDLVLHEIPFAMEMCALSELPCKLLSCLTLPPYPSFPTADKYELSLHEALPESAQHDTSTPGAAVSETSMSVQRILSPKLTGFFLYRQLAALISTLFTALSPAFEDRLFNVIGSVCYPICTICQALLWH
jgi:hypothetical protein